MIFNKKYKTIKVNGEIWKYYVLKLSTVYAISLETSKRKIKTYYCENHYHSKNGGIIDIDITTELIHYIINNIHVIDSMKLVIQMEDEFLSEYFKYCSRLKKLNKILNSNEI